VADVRSAAISRRLNLPPSYVLIHRVSTAGIGVLCQLDCEGPFRAEVIRWMPGYTDPLDSIPDDDDDAAEGVDGPAESLNGTTREPDGAADALNGATGEPDGTAGSLNGITW
jgi:hypothetical protein